MLRQTIIGLCLIAGMAACSPAANTPNAKTPVAPAKAAEPVRAGPETAPAPSVDLSATVVATPPADCATFTAKPAVPSASDSCAMGDTQRLARLDAILAEPNAVTRDQQLQTIESCPGFEPGLLRALRAELAPVECADSIVDPFLKESGNALGIEVSQVLRGQSIAARLLRTSDQPPLLPPPFTRERFERFLNSSIRPWYLAQSKVVFEMASTGAKLSGYGKAIVAIEAGLSDLRFVENVRKVSLPTEMASDHEVVEIYQQALEDALEPRKVRGRDAILVGLLHLSQQGVLNDARLGRAKTQLSRLFSGSRIDALDALLLPELPNLQHATPAERLAATLPSFYADRILLADDLSNPQVVRALLERGLPPKIRQQLERLSQKNAVLARLFARGQLELGRRYFRPADFTRASILLEQKGVIAGPSAKESRFVMALAHALEGGPENAVQLMLTGPMLPKGMGNVESLDKLANDSGPIAAMAAYAAGHLLSIIPQDKPNPDHWLRIARYFDDAERKLTDPAKKASAHARAEDARATAAQIRDMSGHALR